MRGIACRLAYKLPAQHSKCTMQQAECWKVDGLADAAGRSLEHPVIPSGAGSDGFDDETRSLITNEESFTASLLTAIFT